MQKQNKINRAFSLIELSIVILIIGILIAGIVKGQDLYAKIKLASARSLTNSSPVAAIPDLNVWHEATSINFDSLSDGESVAIWHDINPQRTNKNNLVEDVSTKNPTFKKKCINGLPCIEFNDGDGDNDYLKGQRGLDISGSSPATVFIVGEIDVDDADVGDVIFQSSSNTAPNLNLVRFEVSTASNRSGYKFQGANAQYGNVFSNKKSFISTWKWSDGSNSTTYDLYINGTKKSKSGNLDSSSIKLGNAVYLVGSGYSSNTTNITSDFDGYISEVIVFNRFLKTSEQQSVEKYLSQKYGIALN